MSTPLSERTKGLHGMSDAEYEAMEREQAPMMVGTKPWLDPEYARGMQNAKTCISATWAQPQAKQSHQSWWRRRDWWRL